MVNRYSVTILLLLKKFGSGCASVGYVVASGAVGLNPVIGRILFTDNCWKDEIKEDGSQKPSLNRSQSWPL